MRSTKHGMIIALALSSGLFVGCLPKEPQEVATVVCAPQRIPPGGHAVLSILQVSPRPLQGRMINLKDDTLINEANWSRTTSTFGEACGGRCFYYMQTIDIGPLSTNQVLWIRPGDFTNLPPGALRAPIQIAVASNMSGPGHTHEGNK